MSLPQEKLKTTQTRTYGTPIPTDGPNRVDERLFKALYKKRIKQSIYQFAGLLLFMVMIRLRTALSDVECLFFLFGLTAIVLPEGIQDLITLKTKIRQLVELNTFSEKMSDEVERVKGIYALLKTEIEKDPAKAKDSIQMQSLKLRNEAVANDYAACFAEFEFDNEYETIFLLKRKSLPIDEIMQAFHREQKI